MKNSKKFLAIILSLVMMLTLSLSAFAIEFPIGNKQDSSSDEKEQVSRPVDSIITGYNNANGGVMVVADNGYPRLYPEDSKEGLQYCIDNNVQIVSMSVRKTKDKKFVFFEDKTLERMCIDLHTKGPAAGNVSDYTLEELQNGFVLRNSRGGDKRKASKSTIMSLEDALEVSKDNIILYIENGFKYAAEINTLARSYGACDVIILGGAGNTEAIRTFADETGTPICHITAEFKDGTTDGNSKTFVKDAIDAGADCVLLESKNNYSSIFKTSTMKKFESNGRAMVDATTFATSGEHEDRIAGWEELINLGYNVIKTDYPKELADYVKSVESYRAALTSLITQAQTINLNNYSKDTAKALKSALKEAEEVSATGAVSLTELDKARFDLQESIDALEYGQEVEKIHTPIWKIIIIAVIAILLLGLIAIILLRIINKKKASRKERKEMKEHYKQQSEENLQAAKTSMDGSIKPITMDNATTALKENLGIEEEVKDEESLDNETYEDLRNRLDAFLAEKDTQNVSEPLEAEEITPDPVETIENEEPKA